MATLLYYTRHMAISTKGKMEDGVGSQQQPRFSGFQAWPDLMTLTCDLTTLTLYFVVFLAKIAKDRHRVPRKHNI